MVPLSGSADQIKGALARLSDRYRAMIYRSFYHGRTTAQIAAEFGTDDDVVKGELHDALCALRAVLQCADGRPLWQAR
jgi:RNA polymerase sigma-70 factor (ECF subfamily)